MSMENPQHTNEHNWWLCSQRGVTVLSCSWTALYMDDDVIHLHKRQDIIFN